MSPWFTSVPWWTPSYQRETPPMICVISTEVRHPLRGSASCDSLPVGPDRFASFGPLRGFPAAATNGGAGNRVGGWVGAPALAESRGAMLGSKA
jgi:hypothetical protein